MVACFRFEVLVRSQGAPLGPQVPLGALVPRRCCAIMLHKPLVFLLNRLCSAVVGARVRLQRPVVRFCCFINPAEVHRSLPIGPPGNQMDALGSIGRRALWGCQVPRCREVLGRSNGLDSFTSPVKLLILSLQNAVLANTLLQWIIRRSVPRGHR